VSPLGRRLFQFALGPAALAFIGAGSKQDVFSARQMIGEYGDRWAAEWLRGRDLDDWADYLDRLGARMELPIHPRPLNDEYFIAVNGCVH
jgi:hypothetical protein